MLVLTLDSIAVVTLRNFLVLYLACEDVDFQVTTTNILTNTEPRNKYQNNKKYAKDKIQNNNNVCVYMCIHIYIYIHT